VLSRAVYHLTDLPCFVSGRALIMFDPQAKYLPNINPANPGKLFDFVAHPELVTASPTMFAPLTAFGCNFRGPFKVTCTRAHLFLSLSVLPCCAVLCCAVLCCAVLCCAVLCCAVLCCAVLCFSAMSSAKP
jgi:hypothetical protein